MSQTIGLGIDVGGTNTDAVLIDLAEKRILSFAKAPTTRGDLSEGIRDVLRRLDPIYFPKIALISLSTTLATNALVEGIRRRVCGILIGYGPEDYPVELGEEVVLVSGGHTVHGEEREALDEERVKAVLRERGEGIEAYAVCGYFSVRNPEHELRVKRLIQEETGKPVVCGHEISLQLDARKRATTALLNAHLIPLIHELMMSVKNVFVQQKITAPLMVVKGDGSLMSASVVEQRPIETILSGPAASVIGAKYLLERTDEAKDAVLVDMGGTTTDIALLRDGLPRLNPSGARVGGWQTNVVAIDLRTIALGGDSQITVDDWGNLKIGPRRVIPLSYLGYCYPHVAEQLKWIDENRDFRSQKEGADFWISIAESPKGRVDPLSEKVLSVTAGNPLSFSQIVGATAGSPSEVLRRLSDLERRGWIQRSAVTPTDILHLRGIFQAWNREAAEWGIRILCARSKKEVSWLIQKLEETLDRSIGLQILELILSESQGSIRRKEECAFCSFLLQQPFERSPSNVGVQCRLRLRDKIIGIGAPAHAFLPSLAEKMETQAIIPFYAGVANAVGAITSAIVIREELWIKPYQRGFRIHGSSGMAFFESLEEATKEGERRLKEWVRKKAQEAGADQVEVFLEVEENWSTAKGGEAVFIEKRIRARAMGNPKLYAEGRPYPSGSVLLKNPRG